jgi:hypothetical protein
MILGLGGRSLTQSPMYIRYRSRAHCMVGEGLLSPSAKGPKTSSRLRGTDLFAVNRERNIVLFTGKKEQER